MGMGGSDGCRNDILLIVMERYMYGGHWASKPVPGGGNRWTTRLVPGVCELLLNLQTGPRWWEPLDH